MTIEEFLGQAKAEELERVTFTYEVVTPEQAAEWLAHPHPRQRRSGPKKVATYFGLMDENKWEPVVPDPVCLTGATLPMAAGGR